MSSDEIVDRVVSRVKKGAIIQLHTGTEHTAEALPIILDYLKTNNFTCVTVSRLIFHEDYIIDSNGMQKKVSDK